MDLNSTSIYHVLHPTAAFSQDPPRTSRAASAGTRGSCWLESQLNPKNRIDSLDPPLNPLWRIDGCTGLGTQYYAVPLFLPEVPPMRFDVFVPEEAASCPLIRELLDLNAAFHTKDAARVRRLGISSHILRTLQAWTTEKGDGDTTSVAAMYKNLPFGSRIIFENLDIDIRKIKITVAPTHYLEKQLLGLARLDKALGLPRELLPEAIDISRLNLVQQLHDSVCLVRIRQNNGVNADGGHKPEISSKLWVLKALTSGTKYLYTELRNLLQMEPHPHVISRPQYLVTKYCRFGGKTGVVGFITPYHSGGSLRDELPLLRIHGRLTLDLQLKWATQLASALLHVRERGRIFYPDLRLDNVVLSAAGDIVMVDFEQRGVWCEFAAPEVNFFEYVRILASDDPYTDSREAEHPPPTTTTTTTIPSQTRDHFAVILDRLLPNWDALQSREDFCPSPHAHARAASYNIPWQCLDAAEQEAAEVYMLGRALWCVFEGQSAPQRAAPWQSYRRELLPGEDDGDGGFEFPAYRRTPPALRDLLDRCTRGRRPALSGLIVRRASKLVLVRDDREGRRNGGPEEEDEEEKEEAKVVRVAREWWRAEVAAAERFLAMREDQRSRGVWKGNYFGRPTLREVLDELERFREGME
ncbi:hypothetical protein VTK56DRAFT_2439 [Thermocarpiscus australiensis]